MQRRMDAIPDFQGRRQGHQGGAKKSEGKKEWVAFVLGFGASWCGVG